MSDNSRSPGVVVESASWLRDRIDRLVESGETAEATACVNRLLALSTSTETKLFCFRTLGMLAFRDGDLGRARDAFRRATDIEDRDPGTSYALAHCSAASDQWWRTLLHALEAIRLSDDPEDRAEFMRIGALAVHRVGSVEAALSMMFGALEHAPDHPWILQTIGRIYECEERWFEALDVRNALVDVLADGFVEDRRRDRDEESRFHRIFKRFAVKFDISRRDVERRRRALRERLRAEIGPVDADVPSGRRSSSIARLNLPRALHLLIGQLSGHDRNYRLLERAHSIWARARREDDGADLEPSLRAAATQRLVERLGWRIPTSIDVVARVYDVSPDAVPAAVRLLVGRHDIQFVDVDRPEGTLSLAEWRRLDELQRGLLCSEPLGERVDGRMLSS